MHTFTREAYQYPPGQETRRVASCSHSQSRKPAYRPLVNLFGPLIVVLYYAFTVWHYLRRPAVNGIIPNRIIDSKTVFYTWIIVVIFLLDWAKLGLAGFETAALMQPALMPLDARQLLWHSDKAWGTLGGWWKVFRLYMGYLREHMGSTQDVVWRGPGRLWLYLAFSSFLFYASVPLLGLSIDQGQGLRRSQRLVDISGVNQTTFGLKSWGSLPEKVNNVWRQGNPATPFGETVFYAPEGSTGISNTYYEDSIQQIYQEQLDNTRSPVNRTISFFSGPEVAERVFGSAWGFFTNISCLPMSPHDPNLRLFKITSVNNWTTAMPDVIESGYPFDSASYNRKPELARLSHSLTGLYRDIGLSSGVAYHHLIATDYEDMVSPAGFAEIAAETITFKDFRSELAVRTNFTHTNDMASDWQGVRPIHSVVFAALTDTMFQGEYEPKCNKNISQTCNPWMGVSLALNIVPSLKTDPEGNQLLSPFITPEQMTLAMHKIFGVAAAVVMATGPGNWTSEGRLYGLDPANDLVAGRVPYQVVGILLIIWAVWTVVPEVWALVFWERRRAGMLDGFALFRLGAEYKDAIQGLTSDNLGDGGTDRLSRVPGQAWVTQKQNNGYELR
ncbi:uncharacterized protein PG998_010637 [Apiospora kogelbergensis]|uniref:uncharacterized protein n=1 Tax=Apiospora kogelbergensis TaxID=1337665 RepID=UPI00312DC874